MVIGEPRRHDVGAERLNRSAEDGQSGDDANDRSLDRTLRQDEFRSASYKSGALLLAMSDEWLRAAR